MHPVFSITSAKASYMHEVFGLHKGVLFGYVRFGESILHAEPCSIIISECRFQGRCTGLFGAGTILLMAVPMGLCWAVSIFIFTGAGMAVCYSHIVSCFIGYHPLMLLQVAGLILLRLAFP